MYCLTGFGPEVKVIDCRADTVIGTILMPTVAGSMCLNQRQNRLYVTLPSKRHVAVIDCAADTMVSDIAVGATEDNSSMEACYDAQGDRLYCSITAEDSVAVIDGRSSTLTMKIGVGGAPVGVAFDPGTGRLFVANARDGSISIIRDSTVVARRVAGGLGRIPTILRGRLMMPAPLTGQLLDITGRVVLALHSGLNDVRALAPGVYFVREAQAQAQAQAVRKVVLAR